PPSWSDVPHEEQKAASAADTVPQAGHTRASAAPQTLQKRALAGWSAPHDVQFTFGLTGPRACRPDERRLPPPGDARERGTGTRTTHLAARRPSDRPATRRAGSCPGRAPPSSPPSSGDGPARVRALRRLPPRAR